MRRFILRALLRGLLILLAIPLLVILIAIGLLSSETANRWLMEKVSTFEPRLQLELDSGYLWRGWQFSQVSWADEGMQLELDNLTFHWSPTCLRGKRLCIDLLSADTIRLTTTADDSPSEPREDIQLPSVRLPVGIQLSQLQIGSVELNGEPALLRDIQLQAQASGDHLHIIKFRGQGPDLAWQLEGDLRMTGDWPLRVESELQLPPMDGQAWQLQARLGGSVEQLQLEARSNGYLTGLLNAQAQPLQAALPLQARWQGESFLPLQTLPETLTLHGLVMDLEGDLESGIALVARSRFAGEGGDIGMQLNGRITTAELSDLQLQLQVLEQPQRQLTLTGAAGWAPELEATADLRMQQFPWQWLYPQSLGDLEIEQLGLQAQLRGETFSSDLQASLSGVGEHTAELSLSLAGTPEQITVAPLQLITDSGSLRGHAQIGLLDYVSWDAELLLEDLNPQLFVSQLPGSLSGPITSLGAIRAGELELSAGWDINGTLRSQPLTLSGALASAHSQWQVDDLQLQQGENRITGSGHWGDQVRGQLDIQLPQLRTLWPGLGGGLEGNLEATGAVSAPRVALDLRGQRLAYEAFSMARLGLSGHITLNEQMPGNLNLSTSRMRSGDTRLGDLALSVEGDRSLHHLAADLEDGMLELDLRLAGRLADDVWRGQLQSSNIVSDEMRWQLQEPTSLTYRMNTGDLRLAGHCWGHLGSQLCFNGEQQLMPDRQLNLQLRDFPLTTLQPWLPDDFSWAGSLNAQAQLRQRAGATPTGELSVSSRNGEVLVDNPEQQLQLPYDILELTAQLQPTLAQTRLQLHSSALGNLNMQADITDPAGTQELQGSFSLDDVQLDILRPFLPQVETLSGDLTGNGQLSGSLTQPQVRGEIRLVEGHVSGPELPVSFEQMQLAVTIDGQQADIDGRWHSGAGQGSLTGRAAWAPALFVDIKLNGNDLPIRVPPYADLLASPDLHIGLADNALRLTGTIAIPEGEITVRELPASAVRVSADAEIVGAEPEEQDSMPLGITADVQLAIGDQLHFSGFGLTGRLSGLLRVRENMTAGGNLNILDGRFRGYGQRLELRRAQILFAGALSKPYLDIEAIRRADNVIAGLRLTGPADAPISEVFSEPPMAQEQALAYLILGRPLGADTGDSNLLGQAALALGMAGSTPLAENIASSLGLDDFQLDTEGSGLTTSVVATGYITEKLSLRYGVGVFEQANLLALRYDLTRRLYLEAVGGLASSLDFFYRIDF